MESIDRKSIVLRVADRGFQVCYTENYKRPGAGMYENCCCEWREENYGEKEFDKAVKRMQELVANTGEDKD